MLKCVSQTASSKKCWFALAPNRSRGRAFLICQQQHEQSISITPTSSSSTFDLHIQSALDQRPAAASATLLPSSITANSIATLLQPSPVQQHFQTWQHTWPPLDFVAASKWPQLPNSNTTAQWSPMLASCHLVAACTLLVAPQLALAGHQMAGEAAAAALLTCFSRLLGVCLLFQAFVTHVVKGCVDRGELNSTTCQRILLATLLPFTGSMLALHKAIAVCGCTTALVAIGLLQLAAFAVHVLLHLAHHHWFFLKVFWPLLITMLITEILPVVHWPTAQFQAIAAALLSVKVGQRLARVLPRCAPHVAKRVLLPIMHWLAKRGLPTMTAKLSKVLPAAAKLVARFIPKLSRLSARLAGRVAPRYAQDQLAGRTQTLAFPQADGLLTDTVARCIDLHWPRNSTSWVYVVLMVSQLLMIVNAYSPELMFNTACLTSAAADSGTGAAGAALIRFMKFTWGSGFFVAAFACNCLKTAAHRSHLWKGANRLLNLALMGLLLATAATLLLGMQDGAVVSGMYAYLQTSTATAGACFCCMQACFCSLQSAEAVSDANSPANTIGEYAASGENCGELYAPPPLSSKDAEAAERANPQYTVVMGYTVMLLTLLQLTL